MADCDFELPDSPVRQLRTKWPTFGIALQNRSRESPQRVCLAAEKHYEGRGDTWDGSPESKEAVRPAAGFLVSLWLAAWPLETTRR